MSNLNYLYILPHKGKGLEPRYQTALANWWKCLSRLHLWARKSLKKHIKCQKTSLLNDIKHYCHGHQYFLFSSLIHISSSCCWQVGTALDTKKQSPSSDTLCSTDLHFRSPQPHTSQHCKTMHMGLVHHVVWLFASTTFAGTHCTYPWLKCILAAAFGKLLTMVGCTGWVDLGCWLYTEAHKPVLTTAFRFEKKYSDSIFSIRFNSAHHCRIGV